MRAVPHSCQNRDDEGYAGSHLGDVRGRSDLGSGRYQRPLNKPDKEEVERTARLIGHYGILVT